MHKQATMECPACGDILAILEEGEADENASKAFELLDLQLQIFLLELDKSRPAGNPGLSTCQQALVSAAFYRGARCAMTNSTHQKSGD